jgi:hypothetical protein
MDKPKRFHVIGRVRPTPKPKESDGVDYDLGSYDTLEEAEYVQREHWRVGWGGIVIVDTQAPKTVVPKVTKPKG